MQPQQRRQQQLLQQQQPRSVVPLTPVRGVVADAMDHRVSTPPGLPSKSKTAAVRATAATTTTTTTGSDSITPGISVGVVAAVVAVSFLPSATVVVDSDVSE